MDRLLELFRDYVAAQACYDILYSEKAGFLRVCVGEGADTIYFPITGFSDLLRMLIDDFLLDEEARMGHYLRRDYGHVRSLLVPRLEQLEEDRNYALTFMEQEFENCRHRTEQTRRERLIMIQETEKLLDDLRASVTP